MIRQFAIVAALAGICSAGHRDLDTPDEAYVEAGRQWAAVTCEIAGEERPGVLAKGSGVAVAPSWVLTAAHVVEDCRRAVRVRFGDGERRGVVAVVRYPEFVRERVGVHDLALARLNRPLTRNEYPAVGQCRPGDCVQIVGFGMVGRLDGGELDYDGRLRAGQGVISGIGETWLVCHAERGICRRLYCPASGDSGGPMFDADGQLLGIHSYTARPAGRRRGQYGEESCHTYVWLYEDWIRCVMEDEQWAE